MIGLVVAQLSKSGVQLVQRALADWSAVGLVNDMIWIDADQSGAAMGTYIHDGRGENVEVRDWYAKHLRETYSACVLDIWGWQGETGMDTPYDVHQKALTWLPSSVTATHIIAVPSDVCSVPESAFPPYTDVVVLSGLDSALPSTPSRLMDSSGPDFIAHTSAGLAGLARLWTWSKASPSARQTVNNDVPRAAVARSFVRVVDSHPLFQGILSEVTSSVGDGLPVAIGYNNRRYLELPKVEDQPLRCVAVAAGAVAQHNEVMARFNKPRPAPTVSTVKIGILAAIRHYFGYLFEALKSTPRQIVDGLKSKVETKLVQKTQDSLYGEGSQWKVVLTDKLAKEGSKLGASMVGESTDILKSVNPNWSPAPPQAEELWKDMFQVACGLVDGQAPGSPDLERSLPHQGESPMVVTQPGLIAPNPEGPPFMADIDGRPITVRPCDPLTAKMTDLALEQAIRVERDDKRKARLEDVRARLAAWVTRQRSFAWALGSGIAASLVEALDYQAGLLGEPDQDETEQWITKLEESNKKLKRRSIIILILTVAGIVALGILAKQPLVALVLSTAAIVGIGIGWVVLMFIAAVVTCIKQIGVRFRAENALKADHVARENTRRSNRLAVAQEVVRLSGLADQTENWIGLIGELAHHTGKWTKPSGNLAADGAMLIGELPLAMQIAQVAYSPHAAGDVGRAHMSLEYSAKAQLLSIGWFTRAATARIKLAGSQYCASHGLEDDEILEQMFDDSRQSTDGPLLFVSQGLTADENRSHATFQDELDDWVKDQGSSEWQAALRGAHLIAGIDTVFEPDEYLSGLLTDRSATFREDFSPLGAGDHAHENPKDILPLEVVSSDDGFVQAVYRVLVSTQVELDRLRCFVDASVLEETPDDVAIVAPRIFGH